MRTIKFRAWDTLRKEICSWEDILSSDNMQFVFETSNNRWILMQFTGLKDKNGKEIFEGDIIKVPADNFCSAERVGVVIYEEGCFILDLGEWGKKRGSERLCFYNIGGIEVIGNKFEHPKLLEEIK